MNIIETTIESILKKSKYIKIIILLILIIPPSFFHKLGTIVTLKQLSVPALANKLPARLNDKLVIAKLFTFPNFNSGYFFF